MAMGCRRGCFTGVVAAVLVVAGGYAGFRWGGAVFPPLERLLASAEGLTAGPVPSPALARATVDRVEALGRSGRAGERLSLGGAELSSVLRYALPGGPPRALGEPTVAVGDEAVRISGRLAVADLPALPGLGEVLGILPDTVSVELEGALLPFGDGVGAFQLRRVEAARIPVPRRFYAGLLEGLGRTHREGLPSDAVTFPLPGGVRRAFVEDDQVILVSEG